jgi:dihydroflavonol-4-reductase
LMCAAEPHTSKIRTLSDFRIGSNPYIFMGREMEGPGATEGCGRGCNLYPCLAEAKMILVTGATGHIGNVLVRSLLERGECVRALVRPGPAPAALTGLEVEIASGDILDPGSLERAMQGVKLVYHLAARISLATAPDSELERVNLEGTLNVLEAIRRSGRPRLVYASSIYALRKPEEGIRIDETQPFETQNCQGPYDQSKARASLAVQEAVKAGLDAVIVCPTAVTGPYDFHESEAGLAIQLYMRPGVKFIVKGAYDFIDVRDAAQGLILAAERGRRGETYILGSERLTVREVARMIGEAMGSWHNEVEIPLRLAYWAASLAPWYCELTGAKPFFTRYTLDAIGSNSQISHAKASRELGFRPGPARKAILDAVKWFQEMQAGALLPERLPKVAV